MKIIVVLTILFPFFFSAVASACTTFSLSQSSSRLVGNSYDWYMGHGMAVVNKRNVAKVAFVNDSNPVRWISRYGSVTFNQLGREFPFGGMNEMGLVAELMTLKATTYPPQDSRPALSYLQWIQYHLDKYSSTSEVLEHVNEIRIVGDMANYARVHFLVCDRPGACVVIEYLEGIAVTYSGSGLPLNVLTNSTYESSTLNLKNYEGFGGTLPAPQGIGSLDRFVKASLMVSNFPGDLSPIEERDYAFKILSSVSSGDPTQWNIVYNPLSKIIDFKIFHSIDEITSINTGILDFSCSQAVKIMDLRGDLTGNLTRLFVPYRRTYNREAVKLTFEGLGFNLPSEMVEAFIMYPERTGCLD